MQIRKLVATSAMLAAFALGYATPALAQAKLTCRFGVLGNAEFPGTIGMQLMVDKVNAAAKGEVEMQLFPNSQLGGEKEMAEGMRLGSVCGAPINVSVLSVWVPEGQLFDMPFLFRDDGHAYRVLAGTVGQQLAAKYEAHGFKVVGFLVNGTRHPMSKKPVITPEDVKGLKFRVIQSPLHIELWKMLGANPTPIAFPEIYNSMQTGVVDAMDNAKTTYWASKFYEVAPHVTDLGHIYSISAVAFSSTFWKRMNPAQQAIVQSAAMEGIKLQDRLIAEGDEEAMKKAVGMGATYHKVDKAPWQKAMQPIYSSWAPKVGGLAMIKAVQDTP
ncbi:MAG: TRAP transporter substrate-binding protein [Alphaproteobacteria bacterium]|nr:TRAP transporter substrate-binding protein [Alphaproteobacteria bacterium]